jgi:hypothetical protein
MSTIRDFIWSVRLFPNSWERANCYVVEEIFYYDSDNDLKFSYGRMGVSIPEKMIASTPEQIKYVRKNWKQLLEKNIPVLIYNEGNWEIEIVETIN